MDLLIWVKMLVRAITKMKQRIRDYAQKEAFNSKDEVRKNHPTVEAKIAELIEKNKHRSLGDTTIHF
jgi:3-methyladenine DNA glycosylase AlkC